MVSLLCNMALYIEGFMVNSVYLHKYVYLEMICDLKYSALTFKSYCFHHSFNKYLIRAHSELSILLCFGHTIKSKGSLSSGSLLGVGGGGGGENNRANQSN